MTVWTYRCACHTSSNHKQPYHIKSYNSQPNSKKNVSVTFPRWINQTTCLYLVSFSNSIHDSRDLLILLSHLLRSQQLHPPTNPLQRPRQAAPLNHHRRTLRICLLVSSFFNSLPTCLSFAVHSSPLHSTHHVNTIAPQTTANPTTANPTTSNPTSNVRQLD